MDCSQVRKPDSLIRPMPEQSVILITVAVRLLTLAQVLTLLLDYPLETFEDIHSTFLVDIDLLRLSQCLFRFVQEMSACSYVLLWSVLFVSAAECEICLYLVVRRQCRFSCEAAESPSYLT